MRKSSIIGFLCFFWTYTICVFEKITYTFSNDPIDVVIPCHPKDAAALPRIILGIKNNVVNLRRIIIVSPSCFNSEVEWFDEALFPFTKESVLMEICKTEELAKKPINVKRGGWIYQQLLKLYAPFCIPDISSNVLIVDADVIFLKPITFTQAHGAGLYAVGWEYHKPYFDHAKSLLPDLQKLFPQYSGITHHMLFQREVLIDFFDCICALYDCEPWQAILRKVPLDRGNNIVFSAISEYEMYFNFVFARTDQVQLRPLKWKNISRSAELIRCRKQGFHFVALHVRSQR